MVEHALVGLVRQERVGCAVVEHVANPDQAVLLGHALHGDGQHAEAQALRHLPEPAVVGLAVVAEEAVAVLQHRRCRVSLDHRVRHLQGELDGLEALCDHFAVAVAPEQADVPVVLGQQHARDVDGALDPVGDPGVAEVDLVAVDGDGGAVGGHRSEHRRPDLVHGAGARGVRGGGEVPGELQVLAGVAGGVELREDGVLEVVSPGVQAPQRAGLLVPQQAEALGGRQGGAALVDRASDADDVPGRRVQGVGEAQDEDRVVQVLGVVIEFGPVGDPLAGGGVDDDGAGVGLHGLLGLEDLGQAIQGQARPDEHHRGGHGPAIDLLIPGAVDVGAVLLERQALGAKDQRLTLPEAVTGEGHQAVLAHQVLAVDVPFVLLDAEVLVQARLASQQGQTEQHGGPPAPLLPDHLASGEPRAVLDPRHQGLAEPVGALVAPGAGDLPLPDHLSGPDAEPDEPPRRRSGAAGRSQGYPWDGARRFRSFLWGDGAPEDSQDR